MLKKITCLVLFFVLFTESSSFFMPLHASCKIEWDWPGQQCPDIQTKIVAQIGKWNNTDCGTSEKCRYGLVCDKPGYLTARHVTPEKHYVDDLSFTFESKGKGCHSEGKSRSRIWYAVLDYGTNYCNLENLITGSGLDKIPGYTETTSDAVCTQFTSANCEKY